MVGFDDVLQANGLERTAQTHADETAVVHQQDLGFFKTRTVNRRGVQFRARCLGQGRECFCFHARIRVSSFNTIKPPARVL